LGSGGLLHGKEFQLLLDVSCRLLVVSRPRRSWRSWSILHFEFQNKVRKCLPLAAGSQLPVRRAQLQAFDYSSQLWKKLAAKMSEEEVSNQRSL